MRPTPFLLASISLALPLAAVLPAQTEWRMRTLSGRGGHALAYDGARGRVVLFGGGIGSSNLSDTWEWDGNAWTQRIPAVSPGARVSHALAYDSARGKVVLFGGTFNEPATIYPPFSDTWEWDGNAWTHRTPAVSPPARHGHALAYDSARSRVVLFGGSDDFSSLSFSDTWEWDGSAWTQRTPAVSPPARVGHALAYDSARGRVVLFGGWNGSSFSDTWEWDGNAWTQRTPPVSPPARTSHALVYDSARGRVVLFGGSYLSDTWEWDGNAWTQRTTPVSPSARAGHALAYDSARGRGVLFGGRSFPSYFSDTWEWDGNAWTQRTPAITPPARWRHALAYDSARGRVVLFGGSGSSSFLSDTWEWDGNTWTQRTPAVSPPAGASHALAYDSARGRVVLCASSFPRFFDTWEWDGSAWTQRTPAVSPSARVGHALAYDSARGRVVLFGGNYNETYHSDTWEWDGNAWTQQSPAVSPAARASHALAYDSARGRVVLFGGSDGLNLSDTWEYDPLNPARYGSFGSGCPGSAGVPALRGQLPRIAESFRVELTTLPANAAALLLLGSSRTAWGLIPLPFPLDGLGMTGCTLYASGELILPVQNTGGFGSVTFSVPNDPALVGGSFFNQGFVWDPPANAAGITSSNAGEGRIGAK